MTDYALEDLMDMNNRQLHRLLERGHPIDTDAVCGVQYLGSDLSMPRLGHKLLWQTFRKCFVRDEEHGDVRGWNVRMEQRGIHGAQVPKRTRSGELAEFAHYRIRSAHGIRWPKGWRGEQYFDYGIAGNPFGEDLGFTPVASVNDDGSSLILGWEIFDVGGRLVAPPLYWALRPDGPVDHVAVPKRPLRLDRTPRP